MNRFILMILAPCCLLVPDTARCGSKADAPDTMSTLGTALDIQDKVVLRRVHDLLQYVSWTVRGVHVPQTREEAVEQQIQEFYKPDVDSESLMKAYKAKIEPTLTDRIYQDWRDAQIDAWRLVQAAHPELSYYETKALIMKAMNAIWHSYRIIPFPPELRLIRPPDAPPPITLDPEYAWIGELGNNYYTDPRYVKLAELPPADLPDGAMPYLIKLDAFDVTALRRGDDWGTPADELLERYGDRYYPVLVDSLADPEKYGRALESYPATYRLRQVNHCSEEHKKALYRAALVSGWDDAVTCIDGDWGQAIREEFKDSPYGAP